MKTKMTVESFKAKVLPLIHSGCKSVEDMQAKAAVFLTDIELVDDDGTAVEVADLDWKELGGDVETKGEERTYTLDAKQLEDAIQKAIAPLQKEIKRRDKPGQISVGDPLNIKTWGVVRNFSGATNREKSEKAYMFGQWFMGINGNRKAREFCESRGIMFVKESGGIETKVHQEGTNTTGGYLVPEQFMNDLIDLRLEYGVFRRNANIVPMTSDTSSRPRRVSGLTPYFVGESTAGTQSTMAWDRVTLVAKKLMVLTKTSNELNEDAAVSIGDKIAGEIAYAFANKEDSCGFLGTGNAATYGGIVGVNQGLININGVDEGGGLIETATSVAFSSVVLGDFHRLVSILPTYARRAPKFYCSPLVNDQVLQKLAYASGGATAMEIVNGVPRPTFLGYPVEMVEVMSVSATAGEVFCLFGDLSLAADFGDRRSTAIATSDSALNAFEQDEIVVRGTERFDINCHDLGTSSAAGPIVGLIMYTA